MSTTGEEMYSKLTEESDPYDDYNSRPDVRLGAFPVRRTPRLSTLGPYQLAVIGLSMLCAILLISIIAVTTQDKNKVTSQVQKQTQEANVSALTATIYTLQKEKDELQKEKDELQQEKDELLAKLAVRTSTKAPEVVKTTANAMPSPDVCPMNWHQFNNSCYFISQRSKDWNRSQSYCRSQGAHLAIIHTAEEQTFLWDRLPRGHWNSYWFGISDEHTEDVWKWVDGTLLVGGFWEVGEPNNHINEDCGYIVKTTVLTRVAIRSWYDAPCSMSLPFICEKELSASTSTAVPR
ncbi:hypothetical protein PAMA_011940 [Pampus argenteus]